MYVRELMTTELVTCSPYETLAQAARKMAEENIGACPVVDEFDNLVGLITDRDIAVRAVAKGYDPNEKLVEDAMTSQVFTAAPDMSCEDACELMSDNQIRRLPVVEESRLVGMISLADLAIDLGEDELIAETLEKISNPMR